MYLFLIHIKLQYVSLQSFVQISELDFSRKIVKKKLRVGIFGHQKIGKVG